MGSIPLPALDIKPPQQPPNLLEQYGQLSQLKNMMQNAPLQTQALQQQVQSGQLENQQKQQALKDQQAMTSAMQQWDGKDVNQLVPLVIKNGASANAVMGLKSKVLEQQQTYSTIAKNDADAGTANMGTMIKKNDLISGALSPLIDPQQTPDAQLSQAVLATAQDLQQKGLLDPQHVQAAQHIAQSGDPNQIRQQLSIMQKGLMGQSAQMDLAQKQASTAESQSATLKNTAESDYYKTHMGAPGVTLTDSDKFVNNWLQKNNLPDNPTNRLQGQQEYIKETKIAPAQVRVQGLMQMPIAVADPNNPGNTVYMSRQGAIGQTAPNSAEVKTPQATQKYFTSGKGSQQLTAFNTAMQHLDVLNGLAGDLGNSNVQVFNKAAQAWAQQTGNPAPTNFEAAKNAMAGEVASALKASGATDEEIAKVDSTFSRAQSPMQLKGSIATYRTLLRSKANNLQQQYQQGMKGQPNFTGQTPAGGDVQDPFATFGGKAH